MLNVAVVTTVYFPLSHADVIITRWIKPLATDADWGWSEQRSKIVSIYIDQFPDTDIGREICQRHDVPIFDTVANALCRGGNDLAVDAVLLIGEHGDYADNEIGQKLYPRKELFDKIVDVFRTSNRSIPVFSDKHLSWNFDWALEMDRTAREMGFLLLAGSSIPHCLRLPKMQIPPQSQIREAVTVYCGRNEHYGFHSLEFAQAIIESRAGGERGIRSITAWQGEEVWRQLDQDRWSVQLMEAALEAVKAASIGKSRGVRPGDYRDNCKTSDSHPTAFCLEFLDGLHVTHINLGGHMSSWGIGMFINDETQPRATAPVQGEEDVHFAHFATLDRLIEDTFISNQPPFAPQRSLLTTGGTAALMRALAKPGKTLPTPELAIAYDPSAYSNDFSLNE